MRQGLAAAALSFMLIGMSAPSLAQVVPCPCTAPSNFAHLGQTLPRTAARLAAGQRLKIVVLGSSSTAGAGASSPARAYPARLEGELRSRFPHVEIAVVNRGVNGEDATEMLARLQDDVLSERPDLVIWQVGTNAALNRCNLDEEGRLIRAGFDRMEANGADVVLMDLQYVPEVIAAPDAPGMVDLLGRIARERGAGLFHRYAIMRYWREVENMPFAQFTSDDGLHLNDWSYDCIARLLADAIVEAAARPSIAASGNATRTL